MKHLAIYNFSMFREPAASPANLGFREREATNFAAAERAPGFIARPGDDGGPVARPRPPLIFRPLSTPGRVRQWSIGHQWRV